MAIRQMAIRERGEGGSVELFGRRRREVAPALEEALAGLDLPGLGEARRFVVTGVGASEGPARCFASLVRDELGLMAQFVPLSGFYARSPRHLGDTLVVFSQGLSPNARMALSRAADFERTWLFTSARRESESAEVRACLERVNALGATIVTLPPESESGMLARLVGPAVATLAGFALVASARRPELPEPIDVRAVLAPVVAAAISAEARAARSLEAAPRDPWSRPVCFVACGEHLERCRGLPHRWLEALPGPEPALWDVLQVAHGPFQALWDQPATWVALERRDQAERKLFDRLSEMLSPGGHVLVRLRTELPDAWASLDHELQVNELIWRCLSVRPRDTSGWPGSGLDAPLYGLDEPGGS